MKEDKVPMHLVSTFNMLKKAFPRGIDYTSYYPVVYFLYDYMSNRNLAEIMSYFVDKDSAVILNDVYSIGIITISESDKRAIELMLNEAGYEEWKKE